MILILILLLAGGGWTLTTLVRRLKKHRVGTGVWIVFAVLVACGMALGVWCSLFFEYAASSRMRFVGMPIPAAFFHLENGRWVDFVVPPFQAWTTVLTNIVLLMVGTTLPMWLFARPADRNGVADDRNQRAIVQ